MKPKYSTQAYGHHLQSYFVAEVFPHGERFIVNTVRYRKDSDRLVELERHVRQPEGYGDFHVAIKAADDERESYLQCAREEQLAAVEEVAEQEAKHLRGASADIDPFDVTSGCNTRITYLYRDADNFKQIDEIVVAGVLSEEQQQELRDSLDSEGFIPEQVGMRALQADLQAYAPGDDDAWHEIEEISITEDPTTFPGTAKELLAKFKATDWNPEFSDFDLGIESGASR